MILCGNWSTVTGSCVAPGGHLCLLCHHGSGRRVLIRLYHQGPGYGYCSDMYQYLLSFVPLNKKDAVFFTKCFHFTLMDC